MRCFFSAITSVLLIGGAVSVLAKAAAVSKASLGKYEQKVEPVLVRVCEDCHGMKKQKGSYTINSFMQDPNGSYYAPNTADEKKKYWEQFSNATSEVPVYGDGNWVDSWPRPDNAPPPDYSGSHSDNGMRRFFVNRHNLGINAGFADGHVDKITLRGLWDQTWYRGYVLTREPKLPQR